MVSIRDLKEADLFRRLNIKQLRLFGKHFTEENFEPREVVFSQGEPAQNLYILLEGEVNLGVRARGGD